MIQLPSHESQLSPLSQTNCELSGTEKKTGINRHRETATVARSDHVRVREERRAVGSGGLLTLVTGRKAKLSD